MNNCDTDISLLSRSERSEGPGRGRGLQRHVQLHAEYELVGGSVVTAGIDDVLKIGLNVKAVIEIKGVENFSDVLIALHRETRLGIGSDESSLGFLYGAGNVVITPRHTAGIVRPLGPRAIIIGSAEYLQVLQGGARIGPGTGSKKR